MASIVTSVFKATIGLLFSKGRDLTAERLKEGDVTDQQFRSFIVREIDDIKSKLDGISRTNLVANISFFKEGLVYLYKVFDRKASEKDGAETVRRETVQSSVGASVETVSLAKEMRNLQLNNHHDLATRALADAKERFKDARRKATEAFSNEALNTSDRILAMQYRVMATLLEKVDNPAEALAACRLCLEELHSMPAVQKCFNVHLKQGFNALKSLFKRAEREEIIRSVCLVNRVIFDVTLQVGGGVNVFLWPCVDIGEERVDPLRDSRVVETLRKVNMEHLYLAPWSFGQESEEEHRLKSPCGIASNTQGQFIGVERDAIKVFDSSGKHIYSSRLPPDCPNGFINGIATDRDDNLYLLFGRWEPLVYVFDKHMNLHHQFNLTFCVDEPVSVTINDNKVLEVARRHYVGMYDSINGQSGRSFGFGYPGKSKDISDITAANEGRVMVLAMDLTDFEYFVHVFDAQGDHIFRFNVKVSMSCHPRRIAFQPESEQAIILSTSNGYPKMFRIYTKDGEFLRNVHFDTGSMIVPSGSQGMAFTKNGRIAMCVLDKSTDRHKILVV